MRRSLKAINAERMKLWNKVLVRDGQSRLFTEDEIAGAVTESETPTPAQPKEPMTWYRRKKKDLRESVKTESKPNIPESIAEPIRAAAEARKQAHA